MSKDNGSHELRVEATPQQPSSPSPLRSDHFMVVHRDGQREGINLDHIRRITTWQEPGDEERFTRLVFVGEPDEPDHFEGEFPFLVDESLEELLERDGAVS